MPHTRRSVPLLLCAILLAAPVAHATVPGAAYVLPRAVDLLPDRATATQVVLHGVFVNSAGGYPHGSGCGKMHFVCPVGSEAQCRRQWEAIAAAVGTAFCQGFGAAASAVPLTLLRDEAPLASPAAWDVAAGVVPDDYVEKWCPVSRLLPCPAGLGTFAGDAGDAGGGTVAPPAAGCAVAGAGGGAGGGGPGCVAGCVAAALLLRRLRGAAGRDPLAGRR